jgi:hypothetical protein
MIFIRQIKVCGFKISSPEALYARRYSLCKIGFWNHPEFSHLKILAINVFMYNFRT